MQSYTESNTTKKAPSDIKVVKLISKSRFQVYLAHSQSEDQYYAMKVFPYKDGHVRNDFLNEIRIEDIDHPNIIKIVKTKHN